MSKRETEIPDQKPGRDNQMAAANLIMFLFRFHWRIGANAVRDNVLKFEIG